MSSRFLLVDLYTLSQIQSKLFWHNFVKFQPTMKIFGTKMAETIYLCMMHSFTTLPNLYQCTTMWNTDAPNCYIICSDYLYQI